MSEPTPKPAKKPKPQRIRVKIKGNANTTGRGARSKLDATIANQIVTLLQRGITMEIACQATGTSPPTVYAWIAKGKHAEPGHPYREFAEAIGKARALCEINLVEIIQKNAPKDADDAKWLLERMFPARYGKQTTHKLQGDEENPVRVTTKHESEPPMSLNLPAIFFQPRVLPPEEPKRINARETPDPA